MKTSSFQAPWDTGVKLITMLASAILGYYVIAFLQHREPPFDPDFPARVGLALVLLGSGLAFMITGYAVDHDGIVIQRLFWRRRISRQDIATVAAPPLLGRRAIGLCGIWGFCGVSGFAYSRALGFHVVAASAYDRRLVITRHRGWPVVISPADCEAFVCAFNKSTPDPA